MVLGCIIFLATVFLIITLVMDVLYAYLDPRIKAAYMKAKKAGKKKAPQEKEA